MAARLDVLWLPVTPEGKEAVQGQLGRMLLSHAFRNSQRYPALLRYAVEQTLAGAADQLRERTLGVAVFRRTPDYDTKADPVVMGPRWPMALRFPQRSRRAPQPGAASIPRRRSRRRSASTRLQWGTRSHSRGWRA